MKIEQKEKKYILFLQYLLKFCSVANMKRYWPLASFQSITLISLIYAELVAYSLHEELNS